MPVPAPLSLTEPAVAEWLWAEHFGVDHDDNRFLVVRGPSLDCWLRQSRAVLALVEAKVREACLYAASEYDVDAIREDVDAIVAKVLS